MTHMKSYDYNFTDLRHKKCKLFFFKLLEIRIQKKKSARNPDLKMRGKGDTVRSIRTSFFLHGSLEMTPS
jgi:hypothetical protein